MTMHALAVLALAAACAAHHDARQAQSAPSGGTQPETAPSTDGVGAAPAPGDGIERILDAAEAAWHATQPKAPDPIIVEHPIDDTLQTGDSRLLGGGMSIHAPWKRD